jgi:hypothetical protein
MPRFAAHRPPDAAANGAGFREKRGDAIEKSPVLDGKRGTFSDPAGAV